MSHEGVRSSEPMNNFTPRAQQVLALARREADRFHHNFVGTEHLLLGLIRLGHGTAVAVLRKMGLDLEIVRMEVEKQVGTGPDEKMVGNIPYTPRVKKVLALAAKESRALNHTYVGTEHLLLGILREADGVAARVLRNLDVDVEQTRQAILNELDPNFKEGSVEYVVAEEESKKKQDDMIDLSKRYDVYCKERSEAVVYRNVLFKGLKKLFQVERYSILTEYLEVEQTDRKMIFFSRTSIIKFCEHGIAPNVEVIPRSKE